MAVSAIDDRLARTVNPMLKNQRKLVETDIVSVIVQAAVTVTKDIYLVFDNYHRIVNNAVHNVLRRLLQYLPANLHIIIVSRCGLPLILGRFKYQYNTLAILPAELRLTLKEATAFFKNRFSLALTTGQLVGVLKYTGGWLAALEIIGLAFSQSGEKNLTDITGTVKREISDYLFHEIVNVQPEKVRSFLYQTSILKRFDVNLAKHITGFDDAGKILDDLYGQHLLLISAESDFQWYHYHSLFSEAIKANVAALHSDLTTRILQRAAYWFAEHHYFEDAFQHAFESTDVVFFADFLEENSRSLSEQFERASLQRWIFKLPQEILLQRPLLRLLVSAVNIERMQLTAAASTIADIENHQMDLIQSYGTSKRQRCSDLLIRLKAFFAHMDSKNKFNLTRREIEILSFLSAGYKNKDIADKLSISINTVKTHLKNIFRKIEVESRLQAIRRARGLDLFTGADVLRQVDRT